MSRVGRNLGLVVASTLLTLVVAEFAWRVYLRSTGRGFLDDPTEFVSPFFTGIDEPRPIFQGNRLQYRGGDVDREKASDEIRVICFGGSTTVCEFAGIGYTDVLERRFGEAKKGYRVRVLNAGGVGYSTAHILVNLGLRNLDAQPDIVTVYENVNDLSAVWFGEGEVLPDYAQKYRSDSYLGMRHRVGPLPAIAKASRLARFLFSRIQSIEFPGDPPKNGRADYTRGLEIFRRNLKSIVAVARAHHVRVLLASQPARSDWRANEGSIAFNRAVAEVARDEGVAFADVARAVTDDGLFAPNDAIHYNRAGVAAVAEAFYEPLRAEVEEVAGSRGLR